QPPFDPRNPADLPLDLPAKRAVHAAARLIPSRTDEIFMSAFGALISFLDQAASSAHFSQRPRISIVVFDALKLCACAQLPSRSSTSLSPNSETFPHLSQMAKAMV